MRPFFIIVILSLLVLSSTSEARGRNTQARVAKRDGVAKQKTTKTVAVREERRVTRDRAQSVGRPWEGRLQGATQLKLGDGAYIRRPHRAFGTRKTVEYTRRAITETLELYPKAHVLSVGDLSSEHGGQISDHQSHQSGRDVDLGLFYKKKPAGYPTNFIVANESNLDAAATWTLVSKLVSTSSKDGGAMVIYLDYEVQGILYRWAKNHGVSEKRLKRILQYANGRDSAPIVRHYRNHDHHLHVRFSCAKADRDCTSSR